MKTKLLFFFIVLCRIANAQLQLIDSLQACYSFTGNANDETGNGYNATVVNATLTTDRFSNPNKAYDFDGTTNYINLPANSFLNAEYSYSVWVKPNSIPSFGSSSYVISVGSTSGDQAISLQNNSNWVGWSAAGYDNGGSSATQSVTGVLPTTNTWYHLVEVRDNSNRKLYVDGQLVDSDPVVGAPYYGSDITKKAVIGDRFVVNNYKFDGVIDDIRIYNRALTSADVNSVYFSGEQLTCAGFASVNENSISYDLQLYPNPFSTKTVLQTDKFFKDATLTVYNLYGQTVKQIKNINGQTVVLSRDNLASGLYFVRLTEENKTIAADKLVITDK